MKKPQILAILILGLHCLGSSLHAQATLLLEEPFGFFGAMNPTGHAAIYLSRVCAETPITLRRCNPGEMGVVISRYHKVAGYDWIAVPLIPYLYAVDKTSDVPPKVDEKTVDALRDQYRREHYSSLIADGPNDSAPKGEWIQLLGASYDRKIYGFELETTPEQDDEVIHYLNDRANHAHFNLLFRNCSDFAKEVLNRYYPHALHRNVLADTGFTTPKEIAKLLVRYGHEHPELRFSAFVIPQVSGLGRSKSTRGVLESLVKTKKYAVPLFCLHPWVAGTMGVAYLATGRFNPSHYAETVYDPREDQRELPQDLLAARSARTATAP
ncbi:MAG TPA: hypothetical protein VKV04_03570 [Verrucomicrobiae bacterium]|nr:hypothetical protein [Verrucomicrobiae bacterium]